MTFPPFPARLSAPAAAAAAVALTVSGAAFAQKGWETFDSSRAFASAPGPAFTLRLPPGMRQDPGHAGQAVHAGPADARNRLLMFRVIVPKAMPKEYSTFINEEGEKAFFLQYAAQLAEHEQGKLYHLEFPETPDATAEAYIRSAAGSGPDGSLLSFDVWRVIVKEGVILQFGCSYIVPEGVAASEGLSSADNPGYGAYCRPFLDSLAYK
ncbi:MAG: hypothetical protein LBW85_10620 [Deltaproteobacteria bacterium]|jgi:hypothetical protein|nr:hypothetical protein [Deltaproteobacteria bacterium]